MSNTYIDNLNIQDFFDLTSGDILCNTSYPISPDYFSEYRTAEDIMRGVTELSFYFHIPFCEKLCRFCEYTRFLSGNFVQENEYVEKLKSQTLKYLNTHKVKLLHGLDIGGGTPTALNKNAFSALLKFLSEILNAFKWADNFESSMEFSFPTIDEEKINLIANSGLHRLSTGIQLYDEKLMRNNNRASSSLEKMTRTFSLIRSTDIKKINLDVMYGFVNQNKTMLDNTIYIIEQLHPEQVTFYEMRYNVNKLKHQSINRDKLFDEYSYLFEKIKSLGYRGDFGQNTFSIYDDKGVSSYLRSRMYYCVPYKGFGISAQSMSYKGISYNILKSSSLRDIPEYEEITEQDIYLLPAEEIAAKYVCISLYSGRLNISVLSDILKLEAYDFYSEELKFLCENSLVNIQDDICRLTENGFRFYGAIASLFWSKNHKYKYLKSH